jgi:hypothetical protein
MARRISITKLQRRTAAAVELIALCPTITADGRLADDEIVAFKQWLRVHRIDAERARELLGQGLSLRAVARSFKVHPMVVCRALAAV